MELTPRKKLILRAIVETYIATAEPVGSKAVAQFPGLTISTATIRNEMADLTELGLLEQPHTSAGRVPSPAGYRLYVNELMGEHQLTLQETQRINSALNVKMEELDRVIDRAGKVLSQISDYPVFTLAAGSGNATIQRMDLLMVEDHAFIAVVMTDSSVVKNKLFHVEQPLSEPQLQMLSTILNSSFLGLTLEEMRSALEAMAAKSAPSAYGLIALVVEFGMEVLSGQRRQIAHTAGITHLLEHPEYHSLDKAKPLMSYLADEEDATRLPATLDTGQNMSILIGPENVNEALKDTSVVMASYDIGDNMRGVIGVVGPTRMDYAKVTARLSYFADSLTRMFGKGELPPGPPGGEDPEDPS
ncbi:MAG: heat-inducible transcription repressor HrcA [Oscillospiraceae bacterium]|nr:heat-inducible transcription repressor HrcA [Oscillospiraceae bacterium]